MKILSTQDHSRVLDHLIAPADIPLPVSSKALDNFTPEQLQLTCHKFGIYQVVTTELLEFLTCLIGHDKAIEVACGYGTIGRALGIPFSDLRIQDRWDVKQFYANGQQPTINYPDDVEKWDAVDFTIKHKPDIVIASWITSNRGVDGKALNMHGPKEENIIKRCESYITIGNFEPHKTKTILHKVPHTLIKAPWLRSRAAHPQYNYIAIFGAFRLDRLEGFKHEYEYINNHTLQL